MRLLYVLTVLSMMASGCASHDIRQLAPEPISSYRIQATENGVVVAADPFHTKQRAEGAFTIDMTEQGILPVLLVFENRSPDNVVIIKDDIELVDSQGNIRKPVPTNVVVSKFEHNKMAYALLGFGIFSYMSAEEANRKMQQDWNSKELPAEKVLIPSRKTHGVVYFDLGPGLSTFNNSTLHVPLVNLRTNERKVAALRMVVAQ